MASTDDPDGHYDVPELPDAIHGKLNELIPGMVTNWSMWVDYIDEEGEKSWKIVTDPGQNLGTLIGHARCMSIFADESMRLHIVEDD